MTSPSSARLALNCILTAYHLHEWVWGDRVKADRNLRATLKVKSVREFSAWIDQVWPWFPIIRDLANGTKHFNRPGGMLTLKVVSNGPLPAGPDGKGYLALDFGMAEEGYGLMPAAHLLEGTVRFWRDFFRKYRPDAEIPISQHHLY